MGCIKNLEISRSTFDLLRNSYGVRKGCALEVGSKRGHGVLVGFYGCQGGYQYGKAVSSQPEGGRDARGAGGPTAAGQLHSPPLCRQPIQSVSFLRGGYLEMPPKSLSPESSLLATFATKNSSGIILAALGKDAEKASGSQAHVVSSCDPRT